MTATFFGPGSIGLPSSSPRRQHPARVLEGVAPPGWEPSIKKMKKSGEVDNPWALAWWLRKTGAKPARDEEDASLDAQIATALALLAKHALPAVCLAAARGESWAQAELLASNSPVYPAGRWR